MRARRDAALRLLKLIMAAVIATPVVLFCYAGWVNYRNAFAHADEQLSTSLNVISEQASKVFQSVDLTFTSVELLIGGLSDEEIKASEQALHEKLKTLEQALNTVDAVLIVDKDGRTLVSSAISPIPPTVGVADRDYFLAQKEHDAGTFVGAVLQPRVRSEPFFGVSRRRPPRDGAFTGIIMVAVSPKVFSEFYAQLARDRPGAGFSLARADGAILARYPAPPSAVTRFGPNSGFME